MCVTVLSGKPKFKVSSYVDCNIFSSRVLIEETMDIGVNRGTSFLTIT